MTATEQDILNALRELENAAQAARTPDRKPALGSIIAQLDRLTRQLPPEADRELLHYLHKRSYEKARLWLEGLDPEKGTCR